MRVSSCESLFKSTSVSFARLPHEVVLNDLRASFAASEKVPVARQMFDDELQVGTGNIALNSYECLVLVRPVRRHDKMSHRDLTLWKTTKEKWESARATALRKAHHVSCP